MVGGGQKFNCKIIEHLSRTHQVDVLTFYPLDKSVLEKDYAVDLSNANIISLVSDKGVNPALLRILVSKKVSKISSKYDLFFNADGQEMIKPLARHNVLYCHFFETPWYRPSRNFFDFLKLSVFYILKKIKKNHASEYKVYCNSKYTQKWIKRLWNVESKVIYPPVDLPKKTNFRKENYILSTGRITPDKNYEFIIDLFRQTSKNPILKGYKLVICGAKSDEEYFLRLRRLSKNLPVEFYPDASLEKIHRLYSKSKIFIQAKGEKINEDKYPALLEHFGMTVVEAMSYGCVPLVLDKGGYRETVDKTNGFRFRDIASAKYSLLEILRNKQKLSAMSKNSIVKSKKFSLKRMQEEIDLLIKEIQSG
jgi:glycosyltransferase involved in cell wall biosynthesis